MRPRTKKPSPRTSESAPPHAMPSHEKSAPEVVRVWLLGGFRVSVGSRTIDEDAWRLRKAAALVKLVALAPGHRIHREQAMEALWPDLGLRAASNNLRQALHVARRTLHPDPAVASRYLSLRGEQLALCPEGRFWVDVGTFEQAVTTARRSRDPAAYRVASELYSGELLPEDRYDEWAQSRRQELRRTFISLLIELAGLYEERGAEELESAVHALKRVLAEEPTNEEAHVGLMRLYASSGRSGEALRQYGRFSEVLSRELGGEPSASAQALKEEIAAGRFAATPPQPAGPPAGGGVGKHNLPAQRSSFVGREGEILELKRQLAMTRLLTLAGAGGSGKTRLALEVARDLVGAYSDGVWLVELAPLSEEKLVPQAMAKAVGVPEQSGRSLADALVEALRAKEMLLVLDNCEHLVESAARLVAVLLDSCPRLRVLATSREALSVAGESRWPVPALSVPDPRRSPTVGELERSESARLFAERARHRDPSFTMGTENIRAVAEICRRLDGLPLAIELAAARVSALSVEQISEKLEDSLKLLTVGDRTAVPRQRTLRGTLDWSHDLLSEPEQKLLRRLSVFAGGWTLEAAEAVGWGNEQGEALDLLSGLVEKSLVVSEPTGDGGVRYRLLEPVRQYALEKLEESRNAESVRCRHAEYFLALAEEAEPELWGPEDKAWLERLEAEHDNLRAALSWTLERREAELALRLAGALWRFWITRGYYEEGRRWFEWALEKGERVAARAQVLAGLGQLALWQGDLSRAKTAAQEGLKLSNEAGIEGMIAADFLIILGEAARTKGDSERAKELLEAALVLSREAGDRRCITWSLGSLANVSSSQGDHERAKELYEEGLALSRELGGVETIGAQLLSLGYEFLLEGDHERAAALNEEAATLLRNRGYRTGLEYALDNLGWAALIRGDHDRAAELFEESVALCKELGDKSTAAESLEGLACAAGARGEAERAARLSGAAQGLYEAGGYHHTPRELALREPYLADARSRLDGEVWETIFEEGRAMTLEVAIEYALSEEEGVAPSFPTPEQSRSEQPVALTRREEEVAALVARGLTNRQIASELHLSERTVENHVSNILGKLRLTSRTQVASWETEQQLLAPEPD
jgi:predicted ATPase/DNA-binding SARP family transcriptional activator/DNA-binding CsgD family transcriptional regulator/Tfp pilus assembly protein PilF